MAGDECSANKISFSGHIIKNISKAHHPPAEHRRPHSNQDGGSAISCRRAEDTGYPTAGDSLYHYKVLVKANFEQAGFSSSGKHGLAAFVLDQLN